jgi:hypothetical protein
LAYSLAVASVQSCGIGSAELLRHTRCRCACANHLHDVRRDGPAGVELANEQHGISRHVCAEQFPDQLRSRRHHDGQGESWQCPLGLREPGGKLRYLPESIATYYGTLLTEWQARKLVEVNYSLDHWSA